MFKKCFAIAVVAAVSFVSVEVLRAEATEEIQNNVFVCNGVIITQNYLDVNEYNLRYKLPGYMQPKVNYITIHNTANKASALAERNYLNNRRDNVSISYHFAVDESGAIQIMPIDIHGWRAGDGHGEGNMSSIGIEICRSTLYEGDLYPRSEENAVKLAAYLLKIHNLPITALRRHEHWSGKICPHRIINEGRWDEFVKRVQLSLEQI